MENTLQRPNIRFEVFLRCISEYPEQVNESELTYLDDNGEEVYTIFGYLRNEYWIGYGCDIKDGTEFKTASELVYAPIYRGKSLFERWQSVHVDNFAMYPLDLWLEARSIEA